MVHWRYVASELTYRWKRTALLIVGIALAVTLVTTLDIPAAPLPISRPCRSAISAPI